MIHPVTLSASRFRFALTVSLVRPPLCWEGRYLHYRRGHDEKGEAQRGYVLHNY